MVKCVLVHSALKAADELQSYLDIHGDDCHHQSLLHIKCLITEKLIAAPKQSKIADFFQKYIFKLFKGFLFIKMIIKMRCDLLVITPHDKNKQK